nr:uncharacterized protein LOC113830014 [Penaeus vannamei]
MIADQQPDTTALMQQRATTTDVTTLMQLQRCHTADDSNNDLMHPQLLSLQPMSLRLIPQQRVSRLKQPTTVCHTGDSATTGSTTTGDSATTGSTTTGDSATTGSTTTGDSATTGSTTSAPSTTPPQDRIDAEDLLTRYIQFLSDATAPVDDENADQIDSGTVSANSFIEEFDDLIDLIAQTGKRITDGTRALLPRARGDTQQLLDRINNGRIAIREEVERLNPLAENTITLSHIGT